MKYFVTVGDQTFEIVLDGSGTIAVNGEPLSVDMRQSGRFDLFSLLVDNRSLEVVVEASGEGRNKYDVLVAGARYEVEVQDERTRRLASASRDLGAPAGKLAIKAPIPGLVVRVCAADGEDVQQGQPLIVLEAMKMENELRAPRDGRVQHVRVQAGDQVSLGQVLMTLA